MRTKLLVAVICLAAVQCFDALDQASIADETKADAKPVSYSRDIKPILAGRCYACHGPDEGKRKAKLNLDERDSAVKKAIKPGDAAGSPMIERVTSKDAKRMMPPAGSKKNALSPSESDLVRRWIDQGAKFDLHWAYVKPVRMATPEVKNKAWIRNAIDGFIASEHEKRGFQPSPEADRVTLVRRLSFDLIGLPPSPEQVEKFVKDESPDAYEKLADRLLASKHFGERMAVYWLDLVRYADSAGYHSDNDRAVYLYRDYVIDAFNDNKHFDQFTVEQLAGDLVPESAREQKIASGYNKLLMTTEEGGAQAKEYTAKYAADRVRNASVVWMAATMGCCECHNHKFDPYVTKDFYSLEAFFADVKEIAVGRQEQTPVPIPGQAAELKKLDDLINATRSQLNEHSPEFEAALAAWEKQAISERTAERAMWTSVKPEKVESKGGATLTTQDDLCVLSSGKNPDQDIYVITIPTDRKQINGIRLEALTHPTFGNKGLSRSNGNFVLTGFEVTMTPKDAKEAQPVKIAAAAADYSQDGYPIAHAIDNDPLTGWAVDGQTKAENRQAVFTFDKPIAGGEGTILTVVMKHESKFPGHNIGRFRLSFTSVEKPALGAKSLPADLAQAVDAEPAKRSPQQKELLATHYRNTAPELAPLREGLAKLENVKKQLVQTFPTSLIAMAVPPRTVRILPRGNWLDDSGEVVQPAVPAFLGQLDVKDRRATRLDLAKWMVSRDNPITARVYVNRLWLLLFGQGLVKTADDFGTQGSLPTHPELLDWLAVEFMESDWDTKHLMKLIVMSNAYRQSSKPSKVLQERDPQNLWLARQGRFRLDAESVRDNALSISGMLNLKIGGPSAKPYQPAGYWAMMNFPTREYQHDRGENQYRRGLYTHWQRTFLHPSLLAFDAATREECTVERPRSSTPLQALVLLNDPTYVEAARVFAEHILKEGGTTTTEKFAWAFRRAVSRNIKPEELKLLTDLHDKHLKEFNADKEAAKKLVSAGEWPVAKDVNVAELAAWTSVARAILNLHETITRN
jgi:mono/diheme cytochrome c family protein